MDKFELNTYSYIGLLSRSYTVTGEPHVLFLSVPPGKELDYSSLMFLNNLPAGLKVFVETEGNVESVLLISAETISANPTDKLQDDVDLVYAQFGNVKHKLNYDNLNAAGQYNSAIINERNHGLKINRTFNADEYDFIVTNKGDAPFPAVSVLAKENFNQVKIDKLATIAQGGISLDVELASEDGSIKTVKVFYITNGTMRKVYAIEIPYICMYLKSFKTEYIPTNSNIENLINLIESV